jgi:hypothetical protein
MKKKHSYMNATAASRSAEMRREQIQDFRNSFLLRRGEKLPNGEEEEEEEEGEQEEEMEEIKEEKGDIPSKEQSRESGINNSTLSSLIESFQSRRQSQSSKLNLDIPNHSLDNPECNEETSKGEEKRVRTMLDLSVRSSY